MIIKTILFLLIPSFLLAAEVELPTTYQNGSTVTASNLNGNFTAITSQVNGGLDNDNADSASGFRFFETKASLPAAGSQGRVVFQTSDNTLNMDNGSAWLAAVAPSGTLATGKIPYYSSGWTLLTPGTANYALISNGTSSLPTYQQVSLTAGVTGTLPVANGGTGQTTANAAFNAFAPSQTGNSGKILTTNGTDTSWTSSLATLTTTGNVGVGSASPGALLDVAGKARITAGGHLVSTGTIPTLTNCGASTVLSKSTDNAGVVVIANAVITSCELNFASAWTVAPICVLHNESNGGVSMTSSVTTAILTITGGASLAEDRIAYICMGNE